MRNGDYTPDRLEAQTDAARLVATAKTESHPENTVALMTFGGPRCASACPLLSSCLFSRVC